MNFFVCPLSIIITARNIYNNRERINTASQSRQRKSNWFRLKAKQKIE